MKTKHRQKKRRTKVREREGTKSATKFLFPGKNYASPRLSHARTRATSEFEVSLRKCDQFALSTGHYFPSPVPSLHPLLLLLPGAVVVGVRCCGQHCGRYARVGLQNWQPSDSSRGLKKRKTHTQTHAQAHTHTRKHTQRERRMAKLTMIYGPAATGSGNRKSHKSRDNPVN